MNRTELREIIKRKGISNLVLAEELGLSEQALQSKISGNSEFKESEIRKVIGLLELAPGDVDLVFFKDGVG